VATRKKSKLDRFLLRFVTFFCTHTTDAGINLCVINQARLCGSTRRLYFTFTSAQQHFIILNIPTRTHTFSPSKNPLDIRNRRLRSFCLDISSAFLLKLIAPLAIVGHFLPLLARSLALCAFFARCNCVIYMLCSHSERERQTA
jgi:hypothetical protein